jgi:hypothetical protein
MRAGAIPQCEHREYGAHIMSPRSLYDRRTTLAAALLSREDAKALANRILAMGKADETRVNISSDWTGNTRFAGGQITTSGETTDSSVTITSTIGK